MLCLEEPETIEHLFVQSQRFWHDLYSCIDIESINTLVSSFGLCRWTFEKQVIDVKHYNEQIYNIRKRNNSNTLNY